MPTRISLYVLALLLLLLAGASQADESPPQGQLPETLTPLHYRLDLEIDPDLERFFGEAEIDVRLQEPLSALWLHGRGLDVEAASIRLPDGRSIEADYAEIDASGVARLTAEARLPAGETTLVLSYSAPFNSSLEGLYRVEEAGETYAFTHLQPIAARSVFPGFDEPRFKTPYDITLTVRGEDEAISNAPLVESEGLPDGRKRLRFATSEPLPSYLVALAVGPMDIVTWEPIPPTPERSRPLPLRGAAAKGRGAELHYALENTAAMLSLLEDYFGLAYPYAKLDIVAVPAFSPGGMENVGAIFYSEDRILFDATPSIYQKRSYAYIHAHELAHSWFGNYVTPAWWNDLWLNEAFATWMADRIVSQWRPEDFDDRGPLRNARRAMWTDRLHNARAVRQPIQSNHDISNAFDRITYSKGGGLLAMFERYLGEAIFQEGVRRFIKRFPHGTATAEDFMAALAEAADDSMLVIAQRSLLEQSGIPQVELDWRCAEGTTKLDLQQSRYLPAGLDPLPAQVWKLPLCLAIQTDQGRERHCMILKQARTEVTLNGPQCPAWILPNEAGAGYFLWSLPQMGWSALLEAFGSLGAAEQLSVMTSASAAYRNSDLDLDLFLAFAEKAARASAWDVAAAPMQVMRDVKNFILPLTRQEEILALYREIYRPALARFDLSQNLFEEGVSRSEEALLLGDLLWFLALDANDPLLRAQLKPLGEAYLGFNGDGMINPQRLHADFRRLALIVAAEENGLPFVEAIIEQISASRDQSLRNNLIAVLAHLTEPEVVERVQTLILDPERPRREASRLLYRQARRVLNRDAVWDFFRAEEPAILERIPRSHRGSLPWLTSAFCDAEAAADIAAYFEPRIEDWRGGPRQLRQSLDVVNVCVGLAEAQRDDAVAFLDALARQ